MNLKSLTSQGAAARERLGSEPVKKLMRIMAVPSVVAMLMQALYNTVDSIFVSMISSGSFAAVTLAYPVQMIIGALSTGIGVGINSSIARALGSKEYGNASKAALNGLLLGFGTIAIMVLFGLFGTELYVRFYTDDPEVIQAGIIYIRTISLLAVGNIFTQITFSILQGSGNMVIPMISQLAGGASVLALDPLLIFGANLGILGAAMASSLAQAVSMTIGLIGVFRLNQENLPVSLKGFRPEGAIMKDILAVGVPSALTQATTSIVSGIISKLVATYGTDAVAAYGGFNKISTFAVLPVFGVTRGMNPILGYSVGAKDKQRFIEARNLAMRYASFFTVPLAIVFVAMPNLVMMVLSPTPEMIEIGNVAYRILGAPLFFYGVSIVLTQVFPPAKKSYLTMAAAILRQVVFLVPLCTLFSALWGLTGIWVGYSLADALNLLVVIGMNIWFRRKVLDAWDDPAEPALPEEGNGQ